MAKPVAKAQSDPPASAEPQGRKGLPAHLVLPAPRGRRVTRARHRQFASSLVPIASAAKTTKCWLVLCARAVRRTERGARHRARRQLVYVCAGEFPIAMFGRFDWQRSNASSFARPLTDIPSEKLDREIEQLELILGELEEGVAENSERAARAQPDAERGERAKRQDRKPLGRKPLPDHVPRARVLHEAPPACASSSGTVLRKIGEDVTEVLEYVPSFFKVVEHVRPKLSCRACAAIMQAPLPSFPIERGRAGAGLLALPMTRRCRFWRPARGEPRPVDCGSSCATKDHGVARHRRRPFTATRATARRSKPKRCWGCVAASCMRMATPTSYEVDPKRGEPRLVEVACWSHARRKVYDVHVETGAPLAKEAAGADSGAVRDRGRHQRSVADGARGSAAG
jgi:transposase